MEWLYCAVALRAQTASFRNPDFQNFQKTFPLPPPTTVVGLAGAALGLSPQAAQAYFEQVHFRMGVRGGSRGQARDLWKYRTLPGRSVITRELLIDGWFQLVLGSTDHTLVRQLAAGLEAPVQALTLGQSDSLAKVVRVELLSGETKANRCTSALVEGDVLAEVLAQAKWGQGFSLTVRDSDPMTYQLPTRFQYKSDYGVRMVVQRRLFSFVGAAGVHLPTKPLRGVQWGPDFIPTFDL